MHACMRWLHTFPIAIVAACAAAQPPKSELPAGATPGAEVAQSQQPDAARPTTLATEGPAAEPAGGSEATTTELEAADPDAGACPAGMVLVEGDYCTKVEQKCVDSWWDKSNKKKVCERFEPPTRCIGERVHKRYCIDKYSWPNVKGERPEVMNNFYQAQVKCAAVGKRMCTESEWTFACEGPEMKPFPHGYVRDPEKCNGDHLWDHPSMKKVARRDPKELARLWKGVRSGSQPNCISDFGVADLPANNDEVVANERPAGSRWDKFSSVHTGGPWYKGVRNQCRPKIYTHDEGFYYYFLGFRCCSEADGKKNEPRTPRQIRKKRSLDYVERLAQFTVEEVREILELKKTHPDCKCEEIKSRHRRILCKTMCGTLLGPEAKDGR